jgi:Domain of unknown function (DUF4314)
MADAQPPVPEVTDVRDTFMRGDRVALEQTDDPDTRLRPGDEGTVTRYDPKLGQLDVRWDSGSTLSMLLNDGEGPLPGAHSPCAGMTVPSAGIPAGPGHPARLWPPSPRRTGHGNIRRMLPPSPRSPVTQPGEQRTLGRSHLTCPASTVGTAPDVPGTVSRRNAQRTYRFERRRVGDATTREYLAAARASWQIAGVPGRRRRRHITTRVPITSRSHAA